MEEIWRDINGYEGYQISNKGHVTKNGKLLTRGITKNDYIRVHLNSKAFYVHRLVAKAFPEICGEWFDECVVDHIDTNTLNCFANNLKVCTQTDNMKNPITVEKRWNCNGSPILQYDLEGNFIMRYESVADASRNCGCSSPSNISNCANGKTKKAYGYQWKYEESA